MQAVFNLPRSPKSINYGWESAEFRGKVKFQSVSLSPMNFFPSAEESDPGLTHARPALYPSSTVIYVS